PIVILHPARVCAGCPLSWWRRPLAAHAAQGVTILRRGNLRCARTGKRTGTSWRRALRGAGRVRRAGMDGDDIETAHAPVAGGPFDGLAGGKAEKGGADRRQHGNALARTAGILREDGFGGLPRLIVDLEFGGRADAHDAWRHAGVVDDLRPVELGGKLLGGVRIALGQHVGEVGKTRVLGTGDGDGGPAALGLGGGHGGLARVHAARRARRSEENWEMMSRYFGAVVENHGTDIAPRPGRDATKPRG